MDLTVVHDCVVTVVWQQGVSACAYVVRERWRAV